MRRSKLIFQSPLLIAFSLIAVAKPIMWRNPGNISKRDLRYGPGSPELAPLGPFKFLEEAKSGESPKFVIRDARGDEWTVKLGPEAQAETVSTRRFKDTRELNGLKVLMILLNNFDAHSGNNRIIYVDGYVGALRERINQLTQLPTRFQRREKSDSVVTKIRKFNSGASETVETGVSNVFVRPTIKGRN